MERRKELQFIAARDYLEITEPLDAAYPWLLDKQVVPRYY